MGVLERDEVRSQEEPDGWQREFPDGTTQAQQSNHQSHQSNQSQQGQLGNKRSHFQDLDETFVEVVMDHQVSKVG
jgi:hypothetical protein